MTNKVLCGRLLINKHGVVKKLQLADGGGARDCKFTHIDIGFDEIHDILREKFGLEHSDIPSTIYDFQLKKLDTERYRTFYDYVSKNGLQFKGTLLYLCTSEGDERKAHATTSRNTNTTPQPTQNLSSVQRRTTVEPDSSTSPVVTKIEHVSPDNHNRIANGHPTAENLRKLSSASFTHFSFEKSLTAIVNYLTYLVNQYNHENICVELLRQVCTISGLASEHLDCIKKQNQPIDTSQQLIYNNILDKIDNLCRSVKATIELNKMKLSRIDQHSTMSESFAQFHRNFNILRDEWNNNTNNNGHSTYVSSTRSSTSSSAQPLAVSPVKPSTISSSDRPINSSSRRSDVSSTSRSPSSSKRYRTHPNSSRSHSSSSSRHRSETNSHKRIRTSPPSSHRISNPPSSSSHRMTTTENNNDVHTSFTDLLKSLNHLSSTLHAMHFLSFNQLVKYVRNQAESCSSTVKISDDRSLSDAKKLIISIEDRLARRMNDEHHQAAPHGLHPDLKYAFEQMLDSIGNVLKCLDHRQSELQKNQRPRRTRWSSPPPSPPATSNESQNIETKPTINLNQATIKVEDDQSSEASDSSLEDEALMEVAKRAYEQRKNRHK